MNLIEKLKNIFKKKKTKVEYDENGNKICKCKYCTSQTQKKIGKYANIGNDTNDETKEM